MIEKQKDLTVFEDEEQLVLLARKGFEQSASILKKIQSQLELNEIKRVKLFLSPQSGHAESAVYDIRSWVIKECLEDVTIRMHVRPFFRQKMDELDCRTIDTKLYSLSSSKNQFNLTLKSVNHKIKAFDENCKEFALVLMLDCPKNVQVFCERGNNEDWGQFAKRSSHLCNFFENILTDLYSVESFEFYTMESHHQKKLLKKLVRGLDTMGNQTKALFECLETEEVEPKKSSLQKVSLNKPLSRYQKKLLERETQNQYGL